LFYGLNPANKPKLSVFNNKYSYKKMLVEQNITVDSACEHHFLPIIGFANVAYIPKDKVIGLSKINRLVDYYARRPQVQERLVLQILNDLQVVLETKDVIVSITAKHLCVSSRGIKDQSSFTTTLEYGGCFSESEYRNEFLKIIAQQSI
jgi:GTP cyclohydrolase I